MAKQEYCHGESSEASGRFLAERERPFAALRVTFVTIVTIVMFVMFVMFVTGCVTVFLQRGETSPKSLAFLLKI